MVDKHEWLEMSKLWMLVWGKPQIDPDALALAIEEALSLPRLDFRTRVLIRDGAQALEEFWGAARLRSWLDKSPVRARLEAIRCEELGAPGFPFLKESLMERTEAEVAKQFLRELGTKIRQPVKLIIGGAIALILQGFIQRSTADIDIVDEVPEAIRDNRELLDNLEHRYQLILKHFQQHYLPAQWELRIQPLGQFGAIEVYAVNVYDIFLGKLFSARTKDLDDLRELEPRLNKDELISLLHAHTQALRSDASLAAAAKVNGYVLYGEELPN